MSDFVDKLRSAACRGCECDECLLMRASAAEIERLREQLAMGRSSFGEAMKENDRLREQLASAKDAQCGGQGWCSDDAGGD